MTINLQMPEITELKPKITVFGVGGGGGNAVNNMIQAGLQGVDFVVANTDSQALSMSHSERVVQMGVAVTEGLGAGSQPEVGRAAAEEVIDEINDHLNNVHMAFITAGMGGGTGTGAAPVVARAAREAGILTVGVVTKPFHFEGKRRMALADAGIEELQKHVDTLIVIPNQNLFRIANEKTTFADAFAMADQVLYSGVACITDLMVKEGLINLDFADVRSVMREMGKAMMGTGESSGDGRAVQAAEAAIANPLLDDVSMSGARGLLISITGGRDLTLFEVDEAASRIREEVDDDANIILGATFDENMEGVIRVSVVATGIDSIIDQSVTPADVRMAELTQRLRSGASITGAALEAPVDAATPQHNMQAEQAALQARSGLEEELRIPTLAQPAPVQPAPVQNVNTSAPQPAPRQAPSDPNVSLAPLRAPIAAPAAAAPVAQAAPVEQGFVPAQAVVPESKTPRMPKMEDFPQVAQRQMQAKAPNANADAAEERRPMGLLRRLANVGLGRNDEENAAPAAPLQPRQPQPAQAPQAAPVAQRAPEAPRAMPAQAPVATAPIQQPAPRMSAPQPVAGRLDSAGRAPAPLQAAPQEEDQLEIPAFLRRQAN
ncbi:MAG: cell division protein FtsZ [Hyphomicrobiales bacterium]|nr:MAG: cell division protein FtsZ [Hyphomicrobiales bacterium]